MKYLAAEQYKHGLMQLRRRDSALHRQIFAGLRREALAAGYAEFAGPKYEWRARAEDETSAKQPPTPINQEEKMPKEDPKDDDVVRVKDLAPILETIRRAVRGTNLQVYIEEFMRRLGLKPADAAPAARDDAPAALSRADSDFIRSKMHGIAPSVGVVREGRSLTLGHMTQAEARARVAELAERGGR